MYSLEQQRGKMALPKQLVRPCLLYDIKLRLSIAALSNRIRQVFGDTAMSEPTARHWFWKLRSVDLTLYDEPCSSQLQVIDDAALKAAREEDNNQTCGKLAERTGKAYKLSKSVPHTILYANKQERVTVCL